MMKVVEIIFEHRIRQEIGIGDMEFGFIKGKGTTDTIFLVRQMPEKFRAKRKKLYFGSVDLKKLLIRFREQWLIASFFLLYRHCNVIYVISFCLIC